MIGELRLSSPVGDIVIGGEAAYTFGSADNIRRYAAEIRVGSDSPFTMYGVSVNGVAITSSSPSRAWPR